MQHFRGILTRLKAQMVEKLPDGNDLYGYDGVSKDALIASIESAHALSQDITANDESRFEVISLKRAGSELYRILKEFFEIDEQSNKKRQKFNEFLNSLSLLIEKTKITYFIVAKNGLRDDEELSKLRARIEELKALKKDISDAVEPTKEMITQLEEYFDNFAEAYKNSTKQTEQIQTWHSEAATKYSNIEKTHQEIEEWDQEIKDTSTQYQVLLKQIEDLTASAERRRDELRGYTETGKEASEQLIKTKEEHRKLLKEINDTLGDANKVSMAAAFKARKDELITPQRIWQAIFITAIAGIVSVVWKFIIPSIEKGDTLMLAVEVGLVAPFVWLGWFAAEQYSYISKILEDYAFKAAAAMSYEGHKNAAREVDTELESALLKFSMYNMSENPIRLYGDDVHSSPVHKFADSFFKTVFGKKNTSGDVSAQSQADQTES